MRHHHTLSHSAERVGRVGKSAYGCETGVAEEGMRIWRKTELQHKWRLAQNNHLIHRYWVNFMGVEACRGMFHLFFYHSKIQSFHLSRECTVALSVLVSEYQ
jgi:hypothetical protein